VGRHYAWRRALDRRGRSACAVALGVADAGTSLCVATRTRSAGTFGAEVLPESEFRGRPKPPSLRQTQAGSLHLPLRPMDRSEEQLKESQIVPRSRWTTPTNTKRERCSIRPHHRSPNLASHVRSKLTRIMMGIGIRPVAEHAVHEVSSGNPIEVKDRWDGGWPRVVRQP
jgi:hypothetical protein